MCQRDTKLPINWILGQLLLLMIYNCFLNQCKVKLQDRDHTYFRSKVYLGERFHHLPVVPLSVAWVCRIRRNRRFPDTEFNLTQVSVVSNHKIIPLCFGHKIMKFNAFPKRQPRPHTFTKLPPWSFAHGRWRKPTVHGLGGIEYFQRETPIRWVTHINYL